MPKCPLKKDKPDVAATTAKQTDSWSQIWRYGWMQPTYMRSVSFRRKCTSSSCISASRSNLPKLPTEELRQTEGPPSGAPYSYRKVKGTHELIFSWLSRLVVLLVDAYARRRRWWSRPCGIPQLISWQRHAALFCRVHVYFFDIWHPVIVNWNLSKEGVRSPVSRESSLKLIEVTCFLRWPLTRC